MTADEDRAVFLTSGDLAVLRDMMALLEARPTVAGPPLDVEALTRLSRAVELVEDDDTPAPAITLSSSEKQCLELLRDQSVIREKLPLRIRQSCTACGNERIVNPARQAKAAQAARSESSGESFLASAELLSDGHPFLATLSFLGGLGSADSPASTQKSICVRCDGDEFEAVPVTFCPGCRAIRDESVLVRCPECNFDFLGNRTDDPLWTSLPEAMTQYYLARNQATVRKRAGLFENQLWPGQLQVFTGALRADEDLLGMCRCGLPGELGRYVAVLLTTRQLVWAWESAVSGTRSGKVRWQDVRAIREHSSRAAKYDWGIHIEVAQGKPIVLNDFRGVGVSFGDPPLQFTVDSLLRLMVGLHRQDSHPGQVLAATPELPPSGAPQPPPSQALIPSHPAPWPPRTAKSLPPPGTANPPPMPPDAARSRPPHPGGQRNALPPPGWYPDPWRAARLRWWTGTKWTGHLSR
jgi:hypothetical protein